MNWFNDCRWFAVRAKRSRECLAAANVGALGLEVFLPMARLGPAQTGPLRAACRPLFPSYFFARFIPEKALETVDCVTGVLQVIRSGSYPVPVEDEIIREIRSRADEQGVIQLKPADLKPGERVCVQGGPFEGMMGRVASEPNDRKRVAVLLEALWQARVVIEKRWVQAEPA